MGWGIALAIILLLAVLPLKVKARYDAGGFSVRAMIGPVTVWKTPSGKKKSPQANKAKSSEEKKQKTPKPEKTVGGNPRDFFPLVQVALDFLGDFRRKLRVNRLELRLVLAGDDPCDLAINYGRTWIAVGNLLPALERSFVIKKRDIDVLCDFTAEETLVTAGAVISITLGRTLWLLARYGVRALREYKNLNQEKAVQSNE